MRIVMQVLRPDGIWTVFENGLEVLLPYKKDEKGEYAELDPNKEL